MVKLTWAERRLDDLRKQVEKRQKGKEEARRTAEDKKQSRNKEKMSRTYVSDDSEKDYHPRSSGKKKSRQKIREEIMMLEGADRASSTLPRAQSFQAVDRGIGGGIRLKKTVECSSDDSDNTSSGNEATRGSPPPFPRAQTFQAGDRETGRGSRLKQTVEYSSDDFDSDSSIRNSYHRDDTSAPTFGRAHHRDPYIIEPPSPPSTLKKATLQSQSSAPPIVSSASRREWPTRSKTQDYPYGSPTPVRNDENTFGGKYMQAARRKVSANDDFHPSPLERASSSLQKTYDECYLICSTAVYFEGQVCICPAGA
jgi:hypothetical protein